MNSVFYALLSCTFLCIPFRTCGQVIKSSSSEIWTLPETYCPHTSGGKAFELDIWEPYGVNNIIGLDIGLSIWQSRTIRRYRYSFQGIPGYRKHSILGEFGIELSNNLLLCQGIGFGFLESWDDHRASYFVDSHNTILYSISETQKMFFNLDNWTNLIWPASPHVPNCKVSLVYIQDISDQLDIRAAFSFLSGSKNKFFAAITYRINNHELFLLFCPRPFELAFGYAFYYNELKFRLLLEHSPLFGQSPYSSIRWNF